MTTDTLERRVLKAEVTSTPTDGRGTFDFEVHPFEVDLDNERIKNFTNVVSGKRISVPLDYQHTLEEMDPGGTIGTATVTQKDNALQGTAKLDIASNPMAMAVYERLLLPESDPLRLSEVSIFYAFEPSKSFKGQKGEMVQVDCELLGLAVVHKGAQRTAITNVKETEAAKAVDMSTWDGAKAMSDASSAAEYRTIAFERNNTSDPETAAHWALPHHYVGKGPNAMGVSAAMGALNGARGGAPDLKDAGAAKLHLEAHQSEINSMMPKGEKQSLGTATIDITPRFVGPLADVFNAANGAVTVTGDGTATWTDSGWYEVGAKLGRALSAKNEAKLRQALDLLSQVVESVGTTSAGDAPKETAKAEEPEGAKAEEPPTESAADMVRAQWAELLAR